MIKAPDGNAVSITGTANVSGEIRGIGNVIEISSDATSCDIRLNINGDNNVVRMVDVGYIRGLTVRVGNHRAADRCTFTVGAGATFEKSVQALLYQDGNTIALGADCMVSNTVVLRGGEHPHLIFDMDSGDYLDVSDGITIGDHVWIGEGAYVTKNVTVPSGCIVAAHAVVTHRFDEDNVVIGGNPGKVVKRRVEWVRGRANLVRGSRYERSYRETKARLAGVPSDSESFWEWMRAR